MPLSVLLINHHRLFKSTARGLPWGRALAARGHRVDLMCVSDQAHLRGRIRAQGNLRIVESPDLLFGNLRAGWDPVCALRRYRLLQRESRHYDVIHCLDTRPATIWPAYAYARRKGICIVSDWIDWWGRGGLITERRPSWYRLLFGGVETFFEEHYRPRLDGLTVVSHALLERAVGLGVRRERCKFIPGGVDMTVFGRVPGKEDCRARLGIAPNAPVLCFSGLDVFYDLPLAVEAFRIVKTQRADAILLLVGPTPATLRRLIANCLAEGVLALGVVPFENLPYCLPAADVFIMPYSNRVSNVGRWPNKIGDYMACGRPTVSNPVGEVKWLFENHEVGVLADHSAEAMAEAVMRLLRYRQRAHEIGARAKRTAEDMFSWDKQIVELERWYRETIARRMAHAPTGCDSGMAG
ncbi:MAG: glycosyltransferase [Kiritimatiellae bacterium]|nr:glycosyltransferase [Kiritimatiellia bacterium]